MLVVDDEAGMLAGIRAILLGAGMAEPALLSDSSKAMDWVERHRFPLVVLDQMMPCLSGFDLLRAIKTSYPATEVVMLTGVDDVAAAVEAMRYGAYDYLVKPVRPEKFLITVQRAMERYDLRHGLALFDREQSFDDLDRPEVFQEMIARDPAMARVFLQAERIAPTDYSVVVTGESGTGKEMLARIIHRLSLRADGPFVAVNMAAFSGNLFEDEFFGHDKGAFTGAVASKKGFFEAAEGGTIFLDEITELDPALQAKLLRVIQERELYRIGSTKAKSVDVRIIAASNRDLKAEASKGNFRSDLYYRLNTSHIHIPPLRERRKDILPIVETVLAQCAAQCGKPVRSVSPELERRLLNHPFPGNVRELMSIISTAVLMEQGSELSVAAAGDSLAAEPSKIGEGSADFPSLAEMERRHIAGALRTTGGNRTHAARLLGIGLRTLQRKLKDLGGDDGVK